jgi:type IV pilus assembly protein PilW
MNMKSTNYLKPINRLVGRGKLQRGFTLIELMVAVVLGMVTVAIIAQVFAVSEEKKRTTTTGADAQINGTLALYSVQRDVEMAGYGLTDVSAAYGCPVNYQYGSGAAGSFVLAPVVIDAGSNGSNVLTVLRSAKATFSIPMVVTENHPQDSDYYVVESSMGAVLGDVLVAVPPAYSATMPCSVVQVNTSGSKTLTSTNIPVGTGTGGVWNNQSILPSAGYASSSYLFNLGSMSLRRFQLNATSNSLQMSEITATTGAWSAAQDVFQQIVVFKAYYGKDTNGDGVVDTYDATTPTTNAEWQQVRSLRLMVVARSGQFEKDAVTLSPVLWNVGKSTTLTDAATCMSGASMCVSVSLSFLADWQHYRYKVYDTVVPLRNVLWNS